MQLPELRAKWQELSTFLLALHARIDAAILAQQFVEDLNNLEVGDRETWLSVHEAAEYSGHTEQSLRRKAKKHEIESKGRGKSRLFLKSSLPKKSVGVARTKDDLHLLRQSAEQAVRQSVGNS